MKTLLTSILVVTLPVALVHTAPVHFMKNPGQIVNIPERNESALTVFCWKGKYPTWSLVWDSGSFHLNINNEDFKVYYGNNVSSVEDQANSSERFWNPELPWSTGNWHARMPWRSSKFRFNPFQDCCYGIASSESYRMQLEYQNINLLLVSLFLTGLTLFLLAPFLSRSTMVHYTTWVTLGIFFSLVCLTYIMQKRFRQSFFSWVFIAYSLSFYLMSSTLYSLNTMLSTTSLPWVLGYCLVTGLVSWAALYRLGPPSHPRTLSLIQWTLQGFSFILMAMSSYNTKATIIIASCFLIFSMVPYGTLYVFLSKVRWMLFRPKRLVLTGSQFQEQSARETRLALEQLRRHCQNNEETAWSLVTRLRSPGRFAEFVEGGSHVTEEEVEGHRGWVSEAEMTDTTDCDISYDTSDNESIPAELGHRFSCFLCNEKLLGHRFSCAQCILES